MASTGKTDARGAVSDLLFEGRVLHEAGIVGPMRPDKALRVGRTFLRWGASPATGVAVAAIEHPHEIAIIDERGSLTWERLHRRSNALAHALEALGVGPGDGIGVMARNHRGFLETTLAAAKLGASALYLNTMFSGPQLVDVMDREGPKALVYDEEFDDLLAGVDPSVRRIVAWHDGAPPVGATTVEQLIAAGDDSDLSPPSDKPRFVILTSGTTGTPKGAQRTSPDGLMTLASLIDMIPYRSGQTMVIAAPLFHSWGFLHFVVALPTNSTMVLHRRFDPEGALAAVERHRRERARRGAGDGAADPRPARRGARPLLDCRRCGSPRCRARRCRASWRSSGWTASATTSTTSTARPRSPSRRSRRRPTCAPRRAPPGGRRGAPRSASSTRPGRRCAPGEVGRIFVGNEMKMEGYTGGGGKESIDGLLSSGDVGHFDADGRLFVDGRDDEMIVSGGENVFPREVEDLLADLEGIAEVAVIGVEDEKFGQRLKAFVVLEEGASLSEADLGAHVKANLASLQDAARGRVPRRAAAQRHRQGAEARTARSRGERPPRLSRLSTAMSEPARQLKAVREANRDMHAVAAQALEWVKVSEARVAAAESAADTVRDELKERAMKTLREMSAQARKQIEAAKEAQAAAESKLARRRDRARSGREILREPAADVAGRARADPRQGLRSGGRRRLQGRGGRVAGEARNRGRRVRRGARGRGGESRASGPRSTAGSRRRACGSRPTPTNASPKSSSGPPNRRPPPRPPTTPRSSSRPRSRSGSWKGPRRSAARPRRASRRLLERVEREAEESARARAEDQLQAESERIKQQAQRREERARAATEEEIRSSVNRARREVQAAAEDDGPTWLQSQPKPQRSAGYRTY